MCNAPLSVALRCSTVSADCDIFRFHSGAVFDHMVNRRQKHLFVQMKLTENKEKSGWQKRQFESLSKQKTVLQLLFDYHCHW